MKIRYCALVVASILSGCNSDSENPAQGNNGQPYNAPIASNITLVGDALVGSSLSGKYTFTDPNYSPRKEGESQYQWRQSDNDDDASNDKILGNEQAFTLTDNELAQNVYFCVTPVAEGNVSIVGEENCSASVMVETGSGEKPQATDVAIDNMAPTVGETLTGSYLYGDNDGDSEEGSHFVWKQNGKDIEGANQAGFTLTATEEGVRIQFCVTPVSANPDALPNFPATGDQACSEQTAAVAPKSGNAPTATAVSTAGDHTVGSVVTGSYTFDDTDKDLEGQSTFAWKRDGQALPSETAKTYTLNAADKGAEVSFCVTPISQTGLPTSGTEVCSAPITDVTDPAGSVPTITLKEVNISGNDKLPEVDDILSGSYVYQTSGSVDDSRAVWKANNVAIDGVNCTVGQACELTVAEQHLGQALTYCVTPKATDSQAGTEVCSDALTTYGLRLSGKLEFRQTLKAEVFGYQNPIYSWNVDISNTDGPSGDLNKTVQSTAAEYTIGQEVLNHITDEFQSTTGNNNQIIDDADWDQALRANIVTTDTTNAAHYIGKDIEVCVSATDMPEQCLQASAIPAITGGLIYDAKAADKRAIEPVREVTFNNAVYHRPLTEAETMAASNSDFGPHLPKAHYSQTAMGIKWASFKLEHDDGTKPGLDVCLNLYKTDINDSSTWFLPASRTSTDSAYTQNGYAADGNQPPLDNNDLLIRFTNIFNNNSKAAGKGLVGSFSGNGSPLYGWVTNGSYNADKAVYTVTPFWAASKPTANTGQANSVKFYDNGSSGNNSVGNGRYVTCVRAASIQ
ncbi:hypothetical protein [Photobacterium nomapromontoriensis]|uniref:hypothetical protein n=1 Tax=Photobacterium nomapromontoriensis TaxID=2910237 RepID=UPI003D0D4E9B